MTIQSSTFFFSIMMIPTMTMTIQRHDHHLHDHPKAWSSPPWPPKGLPSPSSWTPASSAPMSSDPVSHQSKQVDFFEQTFFAGPRFSFGLKKPFKKQKKYNSYTGFNTSFGKNSFMCFSPIRFFDQQRDCMCWLYTGVKNRVIIIIIFIIAVIKIILITIKRSQQGSKLCLSETQSRWLLVGSRANSIA